MRITRRQLRQLISEEVDRVDEFVPQAAAVVGIARYVVGDESLADDARALWNKLDPRVQKSAKKLGSAAKLLPGKAKKKAVDGIVAMLNKATELISEQERAEMLIREMLRHQ